MTLGPRSYEDIRAAAGSLKAFAKENPPTPTDAPPGVDEVRETLAADKKPAAGGNGKKHPWGDDDPETPLSPAKLADRLGIPQSDTKAREALRGRLRTWRKANPGGGCLEVADRKPKQAGCLSPLGKVWPVIEDMKPSG